MLAKLIASLLTGLALGLLATVLVALIVKGIGGARDLDTSGDTLKLIVGGTLATGLYAALGVGIGAIVRNQVGAIIGALVYVFVLESLLGIIPERRRHASRSTASAASAARSRPRASPATMLGQVAGAAAVRGLRRRVRDRRASS